MGCILGGGGIYVIEIAKDSKIVFFFSFLKVPFRVFLNRKSYLGIYYILSLEGFWFQMFDCFLFVPNSIYEFLILFPSSESVKKIFPQMIFKKIFYNLLINGHFFSKTITKQ